MSLRAVPWHGLLLRRCLLGRVVFRSRGISWNLRARARIVKTHRVREYQIKQLEVKTCVRVDVLMPVLGAKNDAPEKMKSRTNKNIKIKLNHTERVTSRVDKPGPSVVCRRTAAAVGKVPTPTLLWNRVGHQSRARWGAASVLIDTHDA